MILFTFFKYVDDVPYPLFIEIPSQQKLEIKGDWKNLTFPCFKVETMSGNRLSDYSGYFNIVDYENFRKNPGLYFGNEIKDFKEKEVLIGYGSNMYSLIQPVDKCVKEKLSNTKSMDYNFYIWDQVKPKICKQHAPYLKAECKSSYIIKSCSFSKTGSMTGLNPCTVGLFGLFNIKDMGLSIVPLKYFEFFQSRKDVFNYFWFKEHFN